MRDSKKREFNLGVRSYELTIIGIILVSILFVSLQDRIGGVAEPSGQAIVSPPSSGFGGLQARPSNPVAVVEHHCGNGKLEVSAGEVCDDGNKDNGDGCSRTCQFEPGFTKVCTAIELDNVRNDLSGKYIQICDIDVSLLPTYPMKPIGSLGGAFTGIYNGNGRTINNFVYTSTTSLSGLFGYVLGNAKIVNVKMINCDVTGTSYVGCLVGGMYGNSEVFDSSANGKVSGTNDVGGLIGRMSDFSVVKKSKAKVDATATVTSVGGFVGSMTDSSKVSFSSSDGSVSNNNNYAGGFVGIISGFGSGPHPEIINSKSMGSVLGTYIVGGFAGQIVGGSKVINSYSDVTVSYTGFSPGGRLGGFVGYLSDGDSLIQNSYAIGDVNAPAGSIVGGFVGYMDAGKITSSYANSNVNGNNVVGGFIGAIQSEINDDTIIEKSYFEGTVVSSGNNIGGFVGVINYGNSYISQSYSKANVYGGNENAGGFVGLMDAFYDPIIQNSYAHGQVEGKDYIGGFAGKITKDLFPLNGGIKQSYASVVVVDIFPSGPPLFDDKNGGFLGYVDHTDTVSDIKLNHLYWNIDKFGPSNGCNPPPITTPPTADLCVNVHGETENKLKQQTTYNHWDFNNVWEIKPGNLPSLQWEK
jgi:cysteine-rich repeat protein